MREYINNNSKKNEIRMLLKHPSYRGKIIAVLEGDTDIRLFRSLMDEHCVKIESAIGKNNVGTIVCDLARESDCLHRIFGICDADFSRIIGDAIPCEQVFLTDAHDVEIMMLASPAVNNLIAEYGINEEAAAILRERLVNNSMEIAFEVGVFRYINHLYDLNINFKGLYIDLYLSINGVDINIDREKFSAALIARSPNIKNGTDTDYLLEKHNKHISDSNDRMQMCNGHDVTKIISYVLSQRALSNDIQMNQERVERSLRLSYGINYFKSTALYRELASWRDKNMAPEFLY